MWAYFPYIGPMFQAVGRHPSNPTWGRLTVTVSTVTLHGGWICSSRTHDGCYFPRLVPTFIIVYVLYYVKAQGDLCLIQVGSYQGRIAWVMATFTNSYTRDVKQFLNHFCGFLEATWENKISWNVNNRFKLKQQSTLRSIWI